MGGPPQTLAEVPRFVIGGSWSADGVILLGSYGGGILRVPASGGSASPVTSPPPAHKEVGHFEPKFLPDGRHFLYVAPSGPMDAPVLMGSIETKPDEQGRILIGSAGYVSYMPSAGSSSGQLLFVRERTLMAQAFDERRLELSGDPVPIVEHVDDFSTSNTGVLVHRTGTSQNSQLTWFGRDGKALGTVAEPGAYSELRLSPAGMLAAVTKIDELGPQNIWLVDLTRKSITRFTFAAGFANSPVWSPDGTRIAFAMERSGGVAIYQKAVNGTTEEQLLLEPPASGTFAYPISWSRDGRFLIYMVIDPKSKTDAWALPMQGQGKPTRLLGTEFDETAAAISPDGRWLTYASDESGRLEVYARPFRVDASGTPSVGAKLLVSQGGGNGPLWRGDGKELFYLGLDDTVMTVDVTRNPTFPFDKPKFLAKRPEFTAGDVTADGKRSLRAIPLASSTPSPITLIVNWQQALKRPQ